MISEFKSKATKVLLTLRPSSTFLTIHNYINNYGEVSDYSLCFHFNYKNMVVRSKDQLKKLKLDYYLVNKYGKDNLILARKELLNSFDETITYGMNSNYTCDGVYDQVKGYKGIIIPGIKLHHKQDILHLDGYKLHKKIIKSIKYPIIISSPLIIAKDYLRSILPVGKFRQFKLVPAKFDYLTVEKLTLENKDFLKENE